MKGPHWGWYLLIGIVVLAPVGARVWTWPGFKRQALDPQMVQAGQTLFEHKWKVNDPLAAGGDGLGPVFNAASCVECHHQKGVGGAGGLEHNVTTYVFRNEGSAIARRVPPEGVVHAFAVRDTQLETLDQLQPELPRTSKPTLSQLVSLPGGRRDNHCNAIQQDVSLSQRNTPALWGANLIDAIPDRVIIANEKSQRLKWGFAPAKGEDLPVGRALRLVDGRVGHFGWKAQSASLSDFVQAACANELGLGNPGQAQPRPLGVPSYSYQPPRSDLTLEQCDQMTSFVASLPRPVERLEDSLLHNDSVEGKRLFKDIGCAGCHMPKVGNVDGLYSDLLLHDMGQPLEGGGSYNEPQLPRPDPNKPPSDGPNPGEWRTPPLWGVADSAPYLHDGRAPTLEKAIEMHGGQGTTAARNFATLSKSEQDRVIVFLRTLRAP